MKMSDVSCDVSFVDYVSECVKNHDRLEQENAELKKLLGGLTHEYEELLDKSIEYVGSHGTSALAQAKQLLNK